MYCFQFFFGSLRRTIIFYDLKIKKRHNTIVRLGKIKVLDARMCIFAVVQLRRGQIQIFSEVKAKAELPVLQLRISIINTCHVWLYSMQNILAGNFQLISEILSFKEPHTS